MDMLNYTQVFWNFLHPDKPSEPLFQAELVSMETEKIIDNHGFIFHCNYTLEDIGDVDMVIIPAMLGDMATLIHQHQGFVSWIIEKYEAGAYLASNCTGSYFIASTGLLDGKEATTSWFVARDFQKMFPAISLRDERIIVDTGQIITGGTTFSYTNLCIYLIERFFGSELGNYCAKMFLIEKGQHSQTRFMIFSGQRRHGDLRVLEIQDYIESNVTLKFRTSELAAQFLLSERNFIRRFEAATGNLPTEYIQRVKIEYAKKKMEESAASVKEICFETGYEDMDHFRKIFRRHTGTTPSQYRQMFRFPKTMMSAA